MNWYSYRLQFKLQQESVFIFCSSYRTTTREVLGPAVSEKSTIISAAFASARPAHYFISYFLNYLFNVLPKVITKIKMCKPLYVTIVNVSSMNCVPIHCIHYDSKLMDDSITQLCICTLYDDEKSRII